MTNGVLIRLHVKREYRERFLLATRLYIRQSQNEAARPRLELLELEDDADLSIRERHEFVLRESYSSRAMINAHARSEHTQRWLATVAEFADGPLTTQRFQPIAEPPPLPRLPGPAALESATVLPRAHREATAGQSVSGATHSSRPLHLPRLQVVVERVEIASAHEGFLRGAPDLCLLVGCYRITDRDAELLGRAVYRFELGQTAPCEVIRQDRVLDLPVSLGNASLGVYVAILAFEENGGSDIRSAYQDLSDPASLFFWNSLQDDPTPITVMQHAAQLQPNHCERTQTLTTHGSHAATARDDSWVGAASGRVEFSAPGEERLLRCHTRSQDDRNDWLWELSFRFVRAD